MQLTLFMNLELHWTLNRNNISAKRPVPVFINSANVNKCHVAKDKMKQLVAATVLSRLDYCNSVLMGHPWSINAPVQRIDNVAAQLVRGPSPCDHVLMQLYRLSNH